MSCSPAETLCLFTPQQIELSGCLSDSLRGTCSFMPACRAQEGAWCPWVLGGPNSGVRCTVMDVTP